MLKLRALTTLKNKLSIRAIIYIIILQQILLSQVRAGGNLLAGTTLANDRISVKSIKDPNNNDYPDTASAFQTLMFNQDVNNNHNTMFGWRLGNRLVASPGENEMPYWQAGSTAWLNGSYTTGGVKVKTIMIWFEIGTSHFQRFFVSDDDGTTQTDICNGDCVVGWYDLSVQFPDGADLKIFGIGMEPGDSQTHDCRRQIMREIFAYEHKNYAPQFTASFAGAGLSTSSIPDPTTLISGSIVQAGYSDRTSTQPACYAPHTILSVNNSGVYCTSGSSRPQFLLVEITTPNFQVIDVHPHAREGGSYSLDVYVTNTVLSQTDACAMQAYMNSASITDFDDWPGSVWHKIGSSSGNTVPPISCGGHAYCTDATYIAFQSPDSFFSAGVAIMGFPAVTLCPPPDCSVVTIFGLPVGSYASDFIVPFNEQATTLAWPDFTTDTTCASPDDCSSDINVSIQRYDCQTCTNPTACTGPGCADFAAVAGGSYSGNTYTTDAVTDPLLMSTYKARVVAGRGCVNTDTGVDMYGSPCTDYNSVGDCGCCDDVDFNSNVECCICGGGSPAGAIAVSDVFNWIDQSNCSSNDCTIAEIYHLPSAQTPDDYNPAFTAGGSFTWDEFETEHTVTCLLDDCRDQIVYTVQRFNCQECRWFNQCDPTKINENAWDDTTNTTYTQYEFCSNDTYVDVNDITIGTMSDKTFISEPIMATGDLGKWNTRIRACLGPGTTNCEYSDSFFWTDDAYTECLNAASPDTKVNSWERLYWEEPWELDDGVIPVQYLPFDTASPTQSMSMSYHSWGCTNPCCYYCPNVGYHAHCGTATPQMICKVQGSADPYVVPTQFSIDLIDESLNSNGYYAYSFSNDISIVDIVYTCYIETTVLAYDDMTIIGPSPLSNARYEIAIAFDSCTALPAYCEFINHIDLSTSPSELIIDMGSGSTTSETYTAFLDDMTTRCDGSNDCQAELVQAYEFINCADCNDPAACNPDAPDLGCPWIDGSATFNAAVFDPITEIYMHSFTTVATPGYDLTYQSIFKGRIKGVSSNGQIVHSVPFDVKYNWQVRCHEALLYVDPLDPPNVPDYGGDIPWGTPMDSTTPFKEFKNDLCPEWCPIENPNVGCDDQLYEVKCKDSADTLAVYEVPDATVVHGFTVDPIVPDPSWSTPATQVQWIDSAFREYIVTIGTTNENVFRKVFNCKVYGKFSAQTIQAESADFQVKFNVCGISDFCQHVEHYDLTNAEFNPTNEVIIVPKDVPIGPAGSNAVVGFSFPPFKDEITPDCGVTEDCHQELVYSSEYILCSVCTDEVLCEDDGAVSSACQPDYYDCPLCDTYGIRALPINSADPTSQYQFIFGSGNNWLTPHLSHWKWKIVAQSPTTGQVIKSPSFNVLVDAQQSDCPSAVLQPGGSNKPAFNVEVPFGATGRSSDVGFQEFANNICPFYCPTPGNESCGAATYVIECDENFDGNYNEPNDFTATVNSVPATSPPEYTVKMVSIESVTIGDMPGDIVYSCRVKGTLNPGSPTQSIAYSDDFTVEFSPCATAAAPNTPDESCFANTWFDTPEDYTNWDPPELEVEFEVFQMLDPPIVFRHENWTDWFSRYCGVETCGPRTWVWKLVDPVDPLDATIPLESAPTEDATEATLTLSTDHLSKIGIYLLKITGEYPITGLTNEWESIQVTVKDPCMRANYTFVESEKPPEDLLVQIMGGVFSTMEWPFTNDVNDMFFESMEEEGIYEWPICGYPTEYKLVAEDGEDLPFDCCEVTGNMVQSEEKDEEGEWIMIPTGNVTIDCDNRDPIFPNSTYTVVVKAWRIQLDEFENEVESGLGLGGLGQPFVLEFFMPPEINPYATTDTPPEIQDVPDESFKSPFASLTDQKWIVTVIDDGDIDPIITVNLGDASSFLTVTANNGVINIQLTAENAVGGIYTIEIIAVDDSGQISEDSFTIEISAEEELQEFEFIPIYADLEIEVELDELEPLDVWIDSISSTGLMEIRYSAPVLPMRNITNVTEQDYYLVFEQNSDEPDQTAEFKWELIKFHYQYILTQLNFSRPLQVSQGEVLDEVTVYMRSELFMKRDVYGLWRNYTDSDEIEGSNQTNLTDLTAEEDILTRNRRYMNRQRILIEDGEIDYTDVDVFVKRQKPVPNQIDAGEAAILAGQAATAETVLAGVFWIPLLVQIVMSGAMAHVWNIMNTLQIVNTFPLYQVKVPENVIQMQLAFQQFSNVQIIPKDDVYNWVMEYMTDPPAVPQEEDEVPTEDQTVPVEDQIDTLDAMPAEAVVEEGAKLTKSEKAYQDFGMDTGKILRGAMQLVAGGVILAILTFIMYVIDTCAIQYTPAAVQRAYASLKMKVFWSSVLRALIEQYLPTTIATFKSIQIGNNWDGFENVMNSLASFVFVPYIVIYPIWIIVFLRRNRFQLSDRKFMGKFGSLYLNVDYFKFGGLPFTAILIVRRCLFAFNAIFLANLGYSALIQLQFSLWASQAICQYLVRVRPMIDAPNNTAQIFNEISILFFCVMMHNFTDHIPDPDARYQIGWYFLYALYFVIGVNVCVIVVLITRQVTTNQLRRLQMNKQKKRLRAIAVHNSHVDVILLGKSRKEKKPHYIRHSQDDYSDLSNEASINIDQIGMEKKAKVKVERTFLQKRKDAKEYFEERMKKMHDEDDKAQQDLDMMGLAERRDFGQIHPDAMKFEERKQVQDKKTLPTQAVEPWEEQMWGDIAMDPSGNVIKFKQHQGSADADNDWEVVSSPSVRERRRLQQATDWPLSARGHEERKEIIQRNKNRLKKEYLNDGKDANSEQWSWDNENAGSNISQWMGLPEGEGPVDQIAGDFIDDSNQDSFFGNNEFSRQISDHDLHLKDENARTHVGRTPVRARNQPQNAAGYTKKANPQQSSQFSSLSSPSMSSFNMSRSDFSRSFQRQKPQEEQKRQKSSMLSSFTDSSFDSMSSNSIASKDFRNTKLSNNLRPSQGISKNKLVYNKDQVYDIYDYQNHQ